MKPLNHRQREIMHWVVDGYTNEWIADELGLKVQTVKNTLTAIYVSLGAKNRAHAAAIFTRYNGANIERAKDV